MGAVSNLVFDTDGTLPADQLDKLPADLRAMVTAPEFIAQARERIRQQMRADGGLKRTGRRESKLSPIGVTRFPLGSGFNRKARRRLAAALRA